MSESTIGDESTPAVRKRGLPVLKSRDTADWYPSTYELVEAYQRDRRRYAILRREFEKLNGLIVDDYYARGITAGALLLKERSRFLPWRHRFSVAVASEPGLQPDIDEVLRSIRMEEWQSAVLLRGQPQKIMARATFAMIVFLLNVLDHLNRRDKGEEIEIDESKMSSTAIDSAKRELEGLKRFVEKSARASALRSYLAGLPVGAFVSLVGVILTWSYPYVIGDPAQTADLNYRLGVCMAFGAIGAIVSVMVRITRGQSLTVDVDQSRSIVMLAGGFRPIVGAVFGAIIYVFIVGGIVPLALPERADAELYYAGIAFLAGFSERWAQDTIVNSAPRLAAGDVAGMDTQRRQ